MNANRPFFLTVRTGLEFIGMISAMNVPQHLIDQLSPSFRTTTESLNISGVTFQFTRPEDPDSLLDDQTLLQSHDELPWQPYWAQAWEAADGMMAFLLEQDLNGQSVLDVGCGLGLTSAAALHRGANVVLGDNAPPALLFAEINTWPWRERANVVHLDWHTTTLGRRFDWIVGSDILYDRADIPFLDRFFRNHLADAGRLILSDPSRAMTKDFLKEFEGLSWMIDVTMREGSGSRPIRIMDFRL